MISKTDQVFCSAEVLRVSQSALSKQIKILEDDLGHALFLREAKGLRLTEAGRMALSYAESIFMAGNELSALLRDGQFRQQQVIRIGAVATLSRNFQENFLAPLLGREDVVPVLQSGSLDELLNRLSVHRLDLVLSSRRVHRDLNHPWRTQRVARQPVSLVGKPRKKPFVFPEDLADHLLLLPSLDSDIGAGFDLLCEQLGVRYRVRAEVDDMAMLRLLARDSDDIALLPPVVVQDELRSGRLAEYCVVPQLNENFYAIRVQRHFQSPIVRDLLRRRDADILVPVQSEA